MGSFIEVNDTLQITKDQGFPVELNYEKHSQKNIKAAEFEGRVFEFRGKPKIRLYHAPPVRNFLAENIDGKWLYWAQIHMLEVNHDYVEQTTSGKYKIIYIYTPEEMEYAHKIMDRTADTDFLGTMA